MNKGSIVIAELEVTYNKMGWHEFDFFKQKLKSITRDDNANSKAGWYAYIAKWSILFPLVRKWL